MKKLPKTDTEILDYIQKERVIIVAPVHPGGFWFVKTQDCDTFHKAKSLRDAVLSLAHCVDRP